MACLLQAQAPNPPLVQNPPQNQSQPTAKGHPLPPIFEILDANHDGVIDAAEIANASASLKKLDRNGDGKLTPDEYRPRRPDGPPPGANGAKPEGPPKPPGPGPSHPRPPIDLALDANGDEVIDASEIANAPVLLKKLDANGDGKLSREECLPKPPSQRDEPGQSGSNPS